MTPYTPPSFKKTAFHCPHCNAYARQQWYNMLYNPVGGQVFLKELFYVKCEHCEDFSIWLKQGMIHPEKSNAPLPNNDIREDIKDDYLEARSIIGKSPRGAVAILRLCMQKLCEQIGEKGKNINDDIASLVKKGLPIQIQQALDVVRVVGNNAVHPGQIDLQDNVETATALFGLINLIAEVMISQPKQVQALYSSLPTGATDAINKRDSKVI